MNVNSITIQSRHRSQSILVAVAFGKCIGETVVLFSKFLYFFFNRMPRFMHVQIYKTIAYIIGANAAGIQIILFNELTAYAI